MHILAKQRKEVVANPKPVGVKRKPDYTILAPGTTFLVDGANIIGKLGAEILGHRIVEQVPELQPGQRGHH